MIKKYDVIKYDHFILEILNTINEIQEDIYARFLLVIISIFYRKFTYIYFHLNYIIC